MSYSAVICKLKKVRKHPGADRLNLANPLNCQVIISLDSKDEELGVFFDSDGCLSHEMCYENNLYSRRELNKDPKKKGFFGNTRRIKAQNFRGEKSFGFWVELNSLAWTGVDLDSLEEGFTFTHLNGKEVCSKYINPATLRYAGTGKNKNKKCRDLKTQIKQRFSQLREHYDTHHLRREIGGIPEESILYVTSKIHGTSARTGNLYANIPLTSYQEWWNRYFGWIRKYELQSEYQVVSGTRRVVLDPRQTIDGGYYSGKVFRVDTHNKIKEVIPRNITVFYELAGFDETGKSIMPIHSIDKIGDKKLKKLLKKQYGETITYSYGCKPDNSPSKRYRVFVYRATVTSIDGVNYELSWPQVKDLCWLLGLETVPDLLGPYLYNDASEAGREALLKEVEKFIDVPDPIDPSHIIEGVVVRVEAPQGNTYFLKEKSFIFKQLEGLVKSNPDTIDIEEAEELAAVVEENDDPA